MALVLLLITIIWLSKMSTLPKFYFQLFLIHSLTFFSSPAIFLFSHSLLDQKISSVLQHCDDSSILTHVQAVVHNALLSADREQTHRPISFLESLLQQRGYFEH